LKYRGALLVGAAAVVLGLTLVGAEARTLREELLLLLDTHPQIKAGQSAVSAARSRIKETRAAWLPRVDFSGDAGYNIVDSPGRRASAGDPFSGSRESAELTITENLFDGFKRYADKREAEANRSGAAADLDLTTQRLLFQGVTAYLDVRRQARRLEIARASEAAIMRQLNLEDERVRLGSGLSVDVLFAKARLQVAKERRVQIEGDLRDARTRFEQVFGRPPDTATMEDAEAPEDRLPPDLVSAIDTGLAENPQILRAGQDVRAADERRRAAQAGYYPSFDAVALGRLEDDVDGTPGVRREIDLFLSANWEIFSGLATQAAVARARHERDARTQDEAFVRRQVVEDTRLAWQSLVTVRRRLELLQNAVTLAAEVFTARQKLRQEGQATAVEVLDAENELNNARIRLVTADYDRRLAVYRLMLAIGRLTPAELELAEAAPAQ
jgi:adhesin transport system outer membrane protein